MRKAGKEVAGRHLGYVFEKTGLKKPPVTIRIVATRPVMMKARDLCRMFIMHTSLMFTAS